MKRPPRLESSIEKSICDALKKRNVVTKKFNTIAQRAAPDRICLMAPRAVFFLEVKRPGEHLTKLQEEYRDFLRALGFVCEEVHSVDEALAALRKAQREYGLA